jgi:hypothetical protein
MIEGILSFLYRGLAIRGLIRNSPRSRSDIISSCLTQISSILAQARSPRTAGSARSIQEELGPLLFQFGYFNRKAFVGVNDFLARLVPFLKNIPKDRKFVV